MDFLPRIFLAINATVAVPTMAAATPQPMATASADMDSAPLEDIWWIWTKKRDRFFLDFYMQSEGLRMTWSRDHFLLKLWAAI